MVESERKLLRNLVPRTLKAALWGFITFLIYYLPYQLLFLPTQMFPEIVSFEISTLFYSFLGISVFFAVTTKLFSGTIFQHLFSVARALILIIYFVYAFQGGIITLTPSIGEATFQIVADLRIFLEMLILIYLLGLAKSIIQAINFLANKKNERDG